MYVHFMIPLFHSPFLMTFVFYHVTDKCYVFSVAPERSAETKGFFFFLGGGGGGGQALFVINGLPHQRFVY